VISIPKDLLSLKISRGLVSVPTLAHYPLLKIPVILVMNIFLREPFPLSLLSPKENFSSTKLPIIPLTTKTSLATSNPANKPLPPILLSKTTASTVSPIPKAIRNPPLPSPTMKTKLYVLGIILTILAIIITLFSPSSTPLSPLSSIPSTIYNPPSTNYIVMGFAPYWNLKKLAPQSLESITHFAYFHLLLNNNGDIFTKINRREEDPGYTNYKRLISGSLNRGNKPLIITFMPESQTALSTIISSSTSRQNAITAILSTLGESGAMGVNIDFEPLGDTPLSLRNSFTLFIQELNESLKSKIINHKSFLTISIYASSAVRPRIWDLAALTPFTDYFVVMTYDYTMPNSNISGPNSPLRGSGTLFEHDIIKNIAEITKLVPASKLLLGIPFYGYEWDTIDSSKYSLTETRGSVASLERIQKMLDNKTLELVWDRNSLTPYGVSTQSGQVSQIYFENEVSIRLKLDFVKSAGLGGIAIWALGYEGNNTWLWPTIRALNP